MHVHTYYECQDVVYFLPTSIWHDSALVLRVCPPLFSMLRVSESMLLWDVGNGCDDIVCIN
jgi:hypothetical protein